MYMPEKSIGSSVEHFSQFYKVKGVLGKGAFGQVTHCVWRKTGEECAVKIFSKKKIDRESLVQESKILARMKHKNIVRYRKARENSKYVFIEMELCKYGTLRKRLEEVKQFSEAEAILIMRGILNAVQYLHRKDIIHRDLKPDNILFADENLESLKIIDFGLSYKYRRQDFSDYIKERCGTLTFMAPEQAEHQRYNKKVDVWSCAILMYQVLTGQHPLYNRADTRLEYIEKLKNIEWDFPESFSDLAKDLFLNLGKKVEKERYTAKQALTHPWITQPLADVAPIKYVDHLKEYNEKLKLVTTLQTLYFLGILARQKVKIDPRYKDILTKSNDSTTGQNSQEETKTLQEVERTFAQPRDKSRSVNTTQYNPRPATQLRMKSASVRESSAFGMRKTIDVMSHTRKRRSTNNVSPKLRVAQRNRVLRKYL